MATLARVVIPVLPHHIAQRGNRRQQTFFNDGSEKVAGSISGTRWP